MASTKVTAVLEDESGLQVLRAYRDAGYGFWLVATPEDFAETMQFMVMQDGNEERVWLELHSNGTWQVSTVVRVDNDRSRNDGGYES
jgi:hypothetical protein